MTKVVINIDYGGFGLSFKAEALYASKSGMGELYFYRGAGPDTFLRVDPSKQDAYMCLYATTRDLGEVVKDITKDPSYISIDTSKIGRDDPVLVSIVEELGDDSSDCCSKLKVVEIPDDVDWVIDEYDGLELVREKSRTWS